MAEVNATSIVSSWLRRQAPQLHSFVKRRLEMFEPDLRLAGGWGSDACRRIGRFVEGGKAIRGSLALLSIDLFASDADDADRTAALQESALHVAAALELLQAFLLIHDDVIDDDQLRRGNPSIFTQYATEGEKRGAPRLGAQALQFGKSLAICLGDVACLCAMDLMVEASRLSTLSADDRSGLLSYYVREVAMIGVAQMDDVAYGMNVDSPTIEQLFRLYRFKTGRYTFSLPMKLGAILAGVEQEKIELLEQFGEALGILFQVRDNWLGLFGDEQEIGKPVGSDIIADKKTIYRLLLFDAVSPAERRGLSSLFGASRLDAGQLRHIHRLLRATGIEQQVEKMTAGYLRQAHELAEQISRPLRGHGDPDAGLIVRSLVDWCTTRSR